MLLSSSLVSAQERSITLDLGGGTKLELLRVDAGQFLRGSPVAEADRGPDEAQQQVRLSRPFLLGSRPVTRAQFERFIQETRYRTEAEDGKSGGYGWDGTKLVQARQYTWKNPGFAQGPDHPATLVTWFDAQEFCKWLSRKTRLRIQLPTEAQWEYAARAGDSSPWAGGDASAIAWHKGNAGGATHPAAMLKANAWGFYDMSGNVWEWCADWYGPYSGTPVNGYLVDPFVANPPSGDKARRVLRGGSFLKNAAGCRSAARYRNDPKSRNADNGFRVMSFDVDGPPKVMPVQVENPRPSPATVSPKPKPSTISVPTQTSSQTGSSGYPLLFLGAGLFFLAIAFKVLKRIISSVGSSDSLGNTRSTKAGAQITRNRNGFWMKWDVPPGTPVKWTCFAGGNRLDGMVRYEPGPQGQFIVTGQEPSMISVAMIGAAVASSVDTMMGSALSADDDDERRRRRQREEREQFLRQASRRNPSAY